MKILSTCRVCKTSKKRVVKFLNPLEFLRCSTCGGMQWHSQTEVAEDGKVFELTPSARKMLETLTHTDAHGRTRF